jgi:hypothetical protein
MFLAIVIIGTIGNILLAMPFVSLGPIGTIIIAAIAIYGWSILSLMATKYEWDDDIALGCMLTALIAGFGGAYGFNVDRASVMANNWHGASMPDWFLPAFLAITFSSLAILAFTASYLVESLALRADRRYGANWPMELFASGASSIAIGIFYALGMVLVFTIVASFVISVICVLYVVYALVNSSD